LANSRIDSWSIDKIQCSEWGYSGNVAYVWASTLNHDEVSFSMSLHPDGFSVPYNLEVDFYSADLHPYEAQEIVENDILGQAERALESWWKDLLEVRDFTKLKQSQITRGLSAEDSFYASIAYLYKLRAQMQPLMVTQLLSQDMSVPTTTIKERIRKAREKELLTSPGKGMNGQSEMTNKAIKLLKMEGLIK
jgi:hypothetical protein